MIRSPGDGAVSGQIGALGGGCRRRWVMTVQARPRLGFVRMPYHLLGVAAVPRPRADCAAALASAASAALRCAAAPAAADSALLGLDGTMGDASGVGAVARSAGMTVPVAPSGAGEASRGPQADSMSVTPMAITRCPPVRRWRLFLPVMRYLLGAVQTLQWGHCSGPSTVAVYHRVRRRKPSCFTLFV